MKDVLDIMIEEKSQDLQQYRNLDDSFTLKIKKDNSDNNSHQDTNNGNFINYNDISFTSDSLCISKGSSYNTKKEKKDNNILCLGSRVPSDKSSSSQNSLFKNNPNFFLSNGDKGKYDAMKVIKRNKELLSIPKTIEEKLISIGELFYKLSIKDKKIINKKPKKKIIDINNNTNNKERAQFKITKETRIIKKTEDNKNTFKVNEYIKIGKEKEIKKERKKHTVYSKDNMALKIKRDFFKNIIDFVKNELFKIQINDSQFSIDKNFENLSLDKLNFTHDKFTLNYNFGDVLKKKVKDIFYTDEAINEEKQSKQNDFNKNIIIKIEKRMEKINEQREEIKNYIIKLYDLLNSSIEKMYIRYISFDNTNGFENFVTFKDKLNEQTKEYGYEFASLFSDMAINLKYNKKDEDKLNIKII